MFTRIRARARRLEKYNELCRKHDDLSYNDRITSEHACCAYDFASISFVCTKVWDEAHPAGKPLDDIVRMDAWSYYPYVRSGYSLPEPRAHIEGRLDAMDASQWIMLGTGNRVIRTIRT